jgi:hypothetical protein
VEGGNTITRDDNPSAPPRDLSGSQTAGKIFFQYEPNQLNLNIFYRRSESLDKIAGNCLVAIYRILAVIRLH